MKKHSVRCLETLRWALNVSASFTQCFSSESLTKIRPGLVFSSVSLGVRVHSSALCLKMIQSIAVVVEDFPSSGKAWLIIGLLPHHAHLGKRCHI